jgi:hypothetical protein
MSDRPHPPSESPEELDAAEAARVEATLASAASVHRVSRILRMAGAVAVALSLLAGLAMAIAVLSSGFEGCDTEPSVPASGAIRSTTP